MVSLSKNQVDIIASDVRLAKITFMHLADDLIDHICCEVEIEIAKGKSFEEAYDDIKQQVGIQTLQKIQEKTRYLIDKNYRIMKTTMKISGLISMSLLGFATVFKIFHWPGAGVGLVLGFFVLSVLFLPSALYVNYKDIRQKGYLFLHILAFLGGFTFLSSVLFKVMHWPNANILLLAGLLLLIVLFLPLLLIVKLRTASQKSEKQIYVLGFLSLIIFELATLFKFMHWPGASVLLLFGSISLFGVFLPIFLYKQFKISGLISGQFFYITITAMFFILFSFLLSVNSTNSLQETYLVDYDNTIVKNDFLKHKNSLLYENLRLKNDTITIDKKWKKVKELSDSIYNEIDNIKSLFFSEILSQSGKDISNLLKHEYPVLLNDFNSIINPVLTKNTQEFELLMSNIHNFKVIASDYAVSNNDLAFLLGRTLHIVNNPETGETWIQTHIFSQPLITVINELWNLEFQVRMVENKILKIENQIIK